MVKGKDKGRGYEAVYGMEEFYSFRIFIGLSRKCRYYPWEIVKWKTKKNSKCKVFFEIL